MVCASKTLPLALLLLAAALGGAAGSEVRLDIPARLQWANTGGYCGETSIQMSALYYGAYVSQYVVRAAGGAGQGSQILLPASPGQTVVGIGRSLSKAAAKLKLGAEVFVPEDDSAPQAEEFLGWAKEEIKAGHPVIFGQYITDCGEDPDYPW